MGLLVCALCFVAAGIVQAAPGSPTYKPDREKKVRYIAIQIRDHVGKVWFEVINKDNLKDRDEEVWRDYNNAGRAWARARREAKKQGEPFDQKKPMKPMVKRIGSTFRNFDKAQIHADELRRSWERYQAKKQRERERKEEKKAAREGKSTRTGGTSRNK